MSQLRHSDSVQATYMSQAEANEVMELWQRRQKEDAARQAMVTIHDVAEATQLTPQEIQQLLQDVRSARPVARADVKPSVAQAEEVALGPALLKVGPWMGALAFAMTVYLSGGYRQAQELQFILAMWVFATFIFYFGRFVHKLFLNQQELRSLKSASVEMTNPRDWNG